MPKPVDLDRAMAHKRTLVKWNQRKQREQQNRVHRAVECLLAYRFYGGANPGSVIAERDITEAIE